MHVIKRTTIEVRKSESDIDNIGKIDDIGGECLFTTHGNQSFTAAELRKLADEMDTLNN